MRKWGNKTTESLETSKLMFHYRKRQNLTLRLDVLQSFQINISASRKVAQHMNDKTTSIISASFAESYHFASHYCYSSKFFYYLFSFPLLLDTQTKIFIMIDFILIKISHRENVRQWAMKVLWPGLSAFISFGFWGLARC